MRAGRMTSTTVVLGAVLAGLTTATLHAQPPPRGQNNRFGADETALVLRGPGSHIGVSVRDIAPTDDASKAQGGAEITDVRPDGPAAKAGFRAADVVLEFDGERVRSAQQLARLVQETPPGKTVTAVVLRDARRTELSVTPSDTPGGPFGIDPARVRALVERQVDKLAETIPDGFEVPGASSRRLGADIQALSPQLAAHFGAKEGVLVASVDADSPASQAGLKAGDVIINAGGRSVASRADLQRAVREHGSGAMLRLRVVRDKKETDVDVRMEPPIRERQTPPVRRLRPAASVGRATALR